MVKMFESLNTKLKAAIAFLVFFVLPFSVLAQQKVASMCDTTFTVSGDLTIIDIENIFDKGNVFVLAKGGSRSSKARKTAAIIDVKESATYELYARILYSDNAVQPQFNESFFFQICDFSPDVPCEGRSGLDLFDSCVLPCNPNAGANRVVVEDVNGELDVTRKSGTFVLEPGVYSIWLNHFWLIADQYRKFVNADANGKTCGPNVNIDECFNVDSVHLLGLEIRKVAQKIPDLLVEKVIDKSAAQPGDTLAYSVVIKNVGSDTVYNVKLTDDLSDFGDKIRFNQISLTSPAGQFNTSQSFAPTGSRLFFGNRISVTSQALSFSPSDTMNINLGPGQAIQIEYDVTLKDTSFFASFPDTLINLAVASGSCEENTSNNSASSAVVVTDPTKPPPPPNYDLAIEKTVSPGRARPDSIFQYVLTITNHGPATADSIVVTDLLPDTVSIDANSFSVAPDSAAANYFEWRLDSLAGGATAEISFDAFVPGSLHLPPNQDFPFTNTSFVSAPRDTFPDNNSKSATVVVADTTAPPRNYDLAIEKTVSPERARPDSIFQYVLTITNNGPAIADSIVVTDLLPDTVSIDDNSFSVAPDSAAANYFEWRLDSLAVGASAEISFDAFVPGSLHLPPNQDFPFTNTSFVSAPRDTFPDNNSKSATVVVADTTAPPRNYDLAIEKTVSPERARPDSIFQYVLTVTNHGPATADSIVVTDLLPDTVSIDANSFSVAPDSTAANYLEWRLDSLAIGVSAEISFDAFVPGSLDLPPNQDFPFTNTSFVSAPRDTFPDNDSKSATVVVADTTAPPRNYDLGIEKSVVPGRVRPDSIFQYVLTITNNGPAMADSIVVTDLLPDTVSIDDNSFSVAPDSAAENYLEWRINSLAVGATAEISFDAFVPGSLHLPPNQDFPFTNTSFVSAPRDTFPDNNSKSVTVVVADTTAAPRNYDLELTKTVSRDTVFQGQRVEFRIDITNFGSGVAADVAIADAIPAGLVYSNFDPQPLDPFATDTLRWVIPAIDSGAIFAISYEALCPQNNEIPDATRFINTACVIAELDTNASNNCDGAAFVCKPLTNCMADPSSFYLDRNIFAPGKITSPLPEDLVITLNIREIVNITLDIFDITGYPIKRIVAGPQMAGENSYTWDGTIENGGYAGSGVYLVFVRDSDTGGRKLECYLKIIVVQ